MARARYRDETRTTRLVERRGSTGARAERALVGALTDMAAHVDGDIGPNPRLRVLGGHWLRTVIGPSDRATGAKYRYRYTVGRQVTPRARWANGS
ncbi:MAG: hypothetical protein LBJ02_02115 [Bifidobacteriaceae bacterium]|jgi:hypothetical protein|nr:hypothetical protein [Bifidobacteriaceae bacterium]